MGLIVAGWLGRALLHTSLVDRTPLSARQCNDTLHQARANQRGLNMLREELAQEGATLHDELARCGVPIDANALDDAPPITAVVGRSYHARGVEGVTVRRYCVPLPAESLVRVRTGEGSEQELYVAAPALSYVIEASGDKLAKTVMAGMELCGSYLVVGGKAKKCVYGLHPLTTKDELAYGLAALRQAAALPAEVVLSEASASDIAQDEVAQGEAGYGETGPNAPRMATALLKPPSSQLETASAALSGVGTSFVDASQAGISAPSMGSVLSEAGVTPILESLPANIASDRGAISAAAGSDYSQGSSHSDDDSGSLGIASKVLKPSASQLEPTSAALSSGASVPPASSVESETSAPSVAAAQSGLGAIPADTLLVGTSTSSASPVSPADMISARASARSAMPANGGSSALLHGDQDAALEGDGKKELLKKSDEEKVLGEKSEASIKLPLLNALREPQTEEYKAASSAESQSGELVGESLVHDALKSRPGVREVFSRAGAHEILSHAELPSSMREPEEPPLETYEASSQAPAQNSELLAGAEPQNSASQPTAASARPKARIRGLSVCLDALPHVLERSTSPLETSVAALLTLPAMGGGYGFSGLRLNHRLELSPEAQDIAGSETITVDGWFAKARTGFEYDGDEFSELPGAKNRGHGSHHVEAAAKDGMTIHTITRELLSDPKQFDELCYELREELGKPHRAVGPRTLHRRELLRHDLGLAPDRSGPSSEPEGSEPGAEAAHPELSATVEQEHTAEQNR